MATAPRSTAKPKSASKPNSAAAEETSESVAAVVADKETRSRAPRSRAKPVSMPTKLGVKKPRTTTPKAKAKVAKPAADDGRTHPSWKDMIKDCIVDSKDRKGVSRATIKKYITEKYGVDATLPVNLSHLNRAITNGAEDNTFSLPKGPSGRVKLAPKTKMANENDEPIQVKKAAPSAKAPSVKKTPVAKKAVAPNKATLKKAPGKTAKTKSTAPKKTSTTKIVEKKKAAAKAAATKATKAKSASKSAPRKARSRKQVAA